MTHGIERYRRKLFSQIWINEFHFWIGDITAYASLLAGLTLIIIGSVIWKFKLVELLAGYKENSNVDKDLLAKVTGLSLLLLGFLLLAESTLIFKDVIKQDAAILLVLLSIILGTIVTALICTHYSK